MKTTHGVVQIHSAPSALRPHVEWAVGGVLGAPPAFDWVAQPAERGSWRTEMSWSGPVGSAARIASALMGWQRIRFEVTEEATSATEAERYSYTPALGVFRATVGLHGDIMINESRVRKAMVDHVLGRGDLARTLDDLLGTRWDEELDVFRQATEGAPVRWLHQVV